MTIESSPISRWWPLALSEEISADAPSARRCGDQEYVLFRDRQGVAHALEDRCAHRRVPLSLGRITETGALQCGYHGWCFDGGSGQCVAITTLDPSERVPARYKVPAFKVSESEGFLYVWSGTVPEAAESGIPEFSSTGGGVTGFGAALCAVAHDAFIGTLLDAPGLIVHFDGLFILPELLGDPLVIPGRVQTEYALSTYMPPNRTQSPADFPFVLRIEALAGTGQSEISVWSLDEKCVFTAVIAAEPAHPWVTAVRWRYRNLLPNDSGQGGFTMQTTIDPAALVALRGTPAGDLWKGLSGQPGDQRGAR